MPKLKLVLSIAMALVAVLIAVPAAQAAFPGANGKIAFDDGPDVFDFGFDQCMPGGTRISTVNPDGTELTEITPDFPNESVSDCAPAWSPDGTRMVFERTYDEEENEVREIWVMNADGSGQTHLPDGDGGYDPAFSADGESIYFTRPDDSDAEDEEIWEMTSSGVLIDQLTDNGVADFEPTASADGELVAFARETFIIDIDGEATTSEFSAFDGDIFTLDLDGGAETNVTGAATEFSVSEEAPNFSPDSTRIVFARCVQGEDGCGPSSLASVPAGGGAIDPITDNVDVEVDPRDDDPAFAPDGTRIVYWRLTFVEPQSLELAFVAPTGGATVGFPGDDSRFHPDWQPLAVPPPPPAATVAGAAPATQSESRRTPRCFGRKVTILGTNKSEKIVGTRGDDVIKGRKGRDKIFGKGGDDVICGGRGRDKLFGNKGDDILIGGAHADFLNGGSGDNRLFGGTPNAPNRNARNVCAGGGNNQLHNCQVVK